MWTAAARGNSDIAKLLINSQAKVDAKNNVSGGRPCCGVLGACGFDSVMFQYLVFRGAL